jgi:hypothetical protein
MSNETQDSLPLSQFQPLEAILDPVDNSFRLISTISSANFDGVIPDTIIAYPTATTSDIIPGRHILIGESFCIVTRIYENIDPSTTDTLSYEIYYIENNLEKSKTILSSVNTFTDGTQLVIRKDDWDEKSLGSSGWTITTEGNSIFSNVAVRGRVEATSGYFDGNLVVGDPDDPDSPGSMKIGTDVFGSNDGIHINGTNYWYDSGNFSLGTGTSTISFNGSNILFGTGIEISGSISANSLLLNNGAFSMSIQSNHNIVPSSERTVNQLVLSSSNPQLVLTTSTNHSFVEEDFIYLSGLSNSGGGLGALNKVFQVLSVTSNTITIEASQSTESISVNADNNDTTLTVVDSEGVYIGMAVSGVGIASNTTVTDVTDTIITISNATTQPLSNVSITFSTISGTYDSSDAGWTNGLVQYSYDGIYVNQNNYWFSNGLFKIGNEESSVSWNNSTLNVTGEITATSGTIGGFTIGATSLTAGAGSSSVGLAPGTFPFYAGSSTASIAPFRVSNSGVLTATGANITGAITATSGTFSGTVNATGGTFTNTVNVGTGTNKIKLTGGATDALTNIQIGSGGFGVAPFYAEGTGKFSLGSGLSWDPTTSILNVNGILKGFIATETVAVVVNPNSMNFGYFSAVTGSHSAGVGLKIDNNNYWFSNNQFKVGTSSSYFSWNGSILEVTGTVKANAGYIGGASGWQIDGSKIFSGSDETYIALQSSGDILTLPISSIVIDNEGGGLSSIYILSEIPSGYNSTTIDEFIGTSLTLDSETNIVLTNGDNNINSLTNYSYPIQDVSLFQWSLSGGGAVEGSPVSEGYVTFVIYGEDNNQIFIDETVSGLSGENINVGIAGSGIYIGSETPTEAPFSVNQSGILKAASGTIGGFNFIAVSDEGTGGSFVSNSDSFDRDVYTPPYLITLSPTDGIILNANSSLGDATSYFLEQGNTFPDTQDEYKDVLRSTGFTIVDNTGSASNVTMNPYMGIRSESVSALNIAKNGSFEYKAGTSTSYSYSGAGWTAGSGLTLASLSATTSGYSFPSLPYGQQFVGKLSWTTAVSTFLTTQFLLDPDGSKNHYPSPKSASTYLQAGTNGISSSIAVYNSQPNGLFGTSHYVTAYPIKDLKITYTTTTGSTVTINPFTSSDLLTSDMLDSLAENTDITFEGGYLYLSAPYTSNILSFPVTTASGIGTEEATLTIGTHPFYAGQSVSLFDGNTDLGEGDTFEILSVTSTQIVVDDTFYDITGVDTVKSDGSLVYSPLATRGKNGIAFDIPIASYSNANYSLPFTLHLPGYYYGVTFDVITSKTATLTRALTPNIPLDISNGVSFATVNNYNLQYDAEELSLSSTDTVATFDPTFPGIGSYDLIYDSSQSSFIFSSPNLTTINIFGNQTEYFPIGSFSLILDQDDVTKEYVKITNSQFVTGGLLETSLDIYSIVFDDEGDGASSIYIEVSDPNDLIQDPFLTDVYPEVTFSEIGSGANETKLENFTYILQAISTFPYSFDEFGDAIEGDVELPAGRKVLIIYGEDASQTFTDEEKNYNGTPKLITFYENSVTQLTVSRAQLGTSQSPIVAGDQLVTIERVQVASVENNLTNYYNIDKAITQNPEQTIYPIRSNSKITSSSVAFDELLISDSQIAYFDGDTGGGSIWGVDASQPATWSYRPSAVIAQLGGNPLVIGDTPGLSLIKQVSYEPYTYLFTNPSMIVERWDGDTTQSSLTISSGKFSSSSKDARIELVAGTSAANNGLIDIDGSKVRFMGSNTGTNGLTVGPLNGSSSTMAISAGDYPATSYALATDGVNTYISSATSGTTYLRGPNDSKTLQIALGTTVAITGNTSVSGNNTISGALTVNNTAYINAASGSGLWIRTPAEYGAVLIGQNNPDNPFIIRPISAGTAFSSNDLYFNASTSRWRVEGMFESASLYISGSATVNSNLVVNGSATIEGNINSSTNPIGTIYASNWFRSTGQSGWYNQTYGTGIYATDSTYVRVYSDSKSFQVGANHGASSARGTVLRNSGDTYSNRYFLYENYPNEAAYYGSDYMYDGNASMSGSRTLYISSTGTSPDHRIASVGSTRRIKDNIENFIIDEQKINDYLSLSAVTFQYKSAIKTAEENEIDISTVPRELGFIAEDAQDKGLDYLYQVDSDGIADYFAYDKMSMYHHEIIKKQQEMIKDLQSRIIALEERI